MAPSHRPTLCLPLVLITRTRSLAPRTRGWRMTARRVSITYFTLAMARLEAFFAMRPPLTQRHPIPETGRASAVCLVMAPNQARCSSDQRHRTTSTGATATSASH